jgi:EpsI family protein
VDAMDHPHRDKFRGELVSQDLPKPKGSGHDISSLRRGSLGRILLLFVLGGGTGALCLLLPTPNTAPKAGVIMDLPESIGGFSGKIIPATPGEIATLPSDTQIVRREYLNPAGDRIMASIVLSGGEKRSIHRPEVCLPAQGWSMRGGKVEQVPLADGRDLKVMDLSLTRDVEIGPGDRRKLYADYFYWFVGNGVTTPHHWNRVFLTSFDRITKNINHRWAYVIVMSIVTEGFVPNGKNEAQTVEMLKQFTGQIAPTFMRTGHQTSDN